MLLLPLIFLVLPNETTFVETQFEQFLAKYNKSYEGQEYSFRRNIFRQSIDRIQQLNNLRTDDQSAHYGITQYSDLTPAEFMEKGKSIMIQANEIIVYFNVSVVKKAKVPGSRRVKHHQRRYLHDYEKIKSRLSGMPKSFDWRDRQAVTPVRNQGKCGACWAHSVVATIESMVAIETGRLTELSIQQLVDCSNDENQGCHGGDTCEALIWMNKHNVSLETIEDYPNEDSSGDCRAKPEAVGVMIQPNYTCERFVQGCLSLKNALIC